MNLQIQIKPIAQTVLSVASFTAAMAIAAMPTQAATLARSTGEFSFQFSQGADLFNTSTVTDDRAIASSPDAEVLADSEAIALFEPFFASNTFFSEASGQGRQYFGSAYSEAAILGEFVVGPEAVFSFDFLGSLELFTQVETSTSEYAYAFGGVSFALFDITDISQSPILLDFFSLFGELPNQGQGKGFDLQASSGIFLDPEQSAISSQRIGSQRFSSASVSGSFKGYFAENTVLRLVEIKSGEAVVGVPEPSSLLALFTLIGGMKLFSPVLKLKQSSR